jgi:hypothetical protein
MWKQRLSRRKAVGLQDLSLGEKFRGYSSKVIDFVVQDEWQIWRI